MVAIPSETDILIVGAGPTGLALSAELRRRGFEPLTVDKIAEGANTSRAVVIHARTLEVLDPLAAVPQHRTEAVLRARLQALGSAVVRPTVSVGLTLTEGGARVHITGEGSPQEVAARWVIGCDGMNSRSSAPTLDIPNAIGALARLPGGPPGGSPRPWRGSPCRSRKSSLRPWH